MYSKTFSCEITIYPEFHRDQMSGYTKESLNKWISELFTSYNAFFRLSVIQHGKESYRYDSDVDTKDIQFKKLWMNQMGTYIIRINGEGLIMNSLKLLPPINTIENSLDKMTFKYSERSDLHTPTIMAYGKGIGLPVKYNRDLSNCEDWNSGFCDRDICSFNWIIDIKCEKSNYDKAKTLIEDIVKFNDGNTSDVEADPFGLNLKIATTFHLKNENKVGYLNALNALLALVVEDEPIEINDWKMDFSSDDNSFALESYFFKESTGRIGVKNIEI